MSSSHDTYELFSGDTSGIDGGLGSYLLSRRRFYNHDQWQNAIGGLPSSTCVYVGNLKQLTREEQIHRLFSRAGVVRRVIMGLNRETMTPCGFCFVEYWSREDAVKACKYLNAAKLGGRIIKVDLDPGFADGRQYGKSRRTGGSSGSGGGGGQQRARNYDRQQNNNSSGWNNSNNNRNNNNQNNSSSNDRDRGHGRWGDNKRARFGEHSAASSAASGSGPAPSSGSASSSAYIPRHRRGD